MDHGPQRALHVGAAAAIDGLVSVFIDDDVGAEGIAIPGDAGRNADGVGVGVEEERLAGVCPFDHADHVADGVDLHRIVAQRAHFSLNSLGNWRFLAAQTRTLHHCLHKFDQSICMHCHSLGV